MAYVKLHDALPLLVGRTIERTVVVEFAGPRFSVYLIFTDGTLYEFYGDYLGGGRRTLDQGGVDDVVRWCRESAKMIMVEPDRRRVPR